MNNVFIECTFTRTFTSNVLQWFNSTNACRVTLTADEILFGVFTNSLDKKITRKFNYTITFTINHVLCE